MLMCINFSMFRYLSVSAGYWGTFDDDSAFFEVMHSYIMNDY